MKIKNVKLLIFTIVVSQLAGIIGSAFTASSVTTWFPTLEKPFFNPPNWLFGPVWIMLYMLMGISLYLVWSKGLKKKAVKHAVYVFLFHLVLNTLWSILFFGARQLGLAFVEISILLALIIYIIKGSCPVNNQLSV